MLLAHRKAQKTQSPLQCCCSASRRYCLPTLPGKALDGDRLAHFGHRVYELVRPRTSLDRKLVQTEDAFELLVPLWLGLMHALLVSRRRDILLPLRFALPSDLRCDRVCKTYPRASMLSVPAACLWDLHGELTTISPTISSKQHRC